MSLVTQFFGTQYSMCILRLVFLYAGRVFLFLFIFIVISCIIFVLTHWRTKP